MSALAPLISPLRGTLAGIVPCVIWSAAVIVMNKLGASFGPLRAAGLELGLAGSILLCAAWGRGDLGRMIKHSRRCLLVCGSFWFLNLTLSWLAFASVRSSGELLVAGLLNYLWPSLTLLFAIPILHRRATWVVVPGIAFVLTGLILGKFATAPPEASRDALMHINPLAYSLAILDAIAWALYSNLSRKLAHPEGASAVPVYMLVTSVALLFASACFETPREVAPSDWILLLAWSLATALAYLFWDVGMRFGNVVTISTTSMLIPLLSTIITALISEHEISPALLTAATMVVVGSSICRRGVV